MESVTTDLFATKGVEYLLVIGYLFLLVGCWRLIFPRKVREVPAPATEAEPASEPARRFRVPEGYYFHQGHSWAQLEDAHVVRVGMDDFAQKLLGLTYGVELPAIGSHVTDGEPGWQVHLADGSMMPMLAPVAGEVVSVNPEVLLHPGLMNTDPYERGWLMKVLVHNPVAVKRNLLTHDLAAAWMDHVGREIPDAHAPELRIVLPGGTHGTTGLARAIAPHDWHRVAREFLLIDEPVTRAEVTAAQEVESATVDA